MKSSGAAAAGGISRSARMRFVTRTRLITRRPLKEGVKLRLAYIPPLFKEQLLILGHQCHHLTLCHPCL